MTLSTIFRSLVSALGITTAQNPIHHGQTFPSHPGGQPHLPRGQAPAPGLYSDPRPVQASRKLPSRKDRRRMHGKAVAYARTKAFDKGDHRGANLA